MMPLSEIKIGDVFSNPTGRGYGNYSGLEFVVIDKKDGLVKVQPHRYSDFSPYGAPFWKKPTDRMFSGSWRIQRGLPV